MTEVPEYRFGVSEFTTWPWSFEEDVTRYAELGVEVIEVCEFKLADSGADDQLASIGQHNLTISSVQPSTRTLFPSQSQPEPKDIGDRMQRFRHTIERFGDLAAGVPFVTNTGNPPNGNMKEVLDVAGREYARLSDFALEFDARIALEPLNPTILNVETAIWTLQQAMDVVAAVDRENFGICLDVWNIWQNPDVLAEIRACGDRIFVTQLSDWRTPRSFQDRHILGHGDIPLPSLLRATHESGYRGAYVVEIFSGDVPDSLWKRDLSSVIEACRVGLRHAWLRAFE